MESTGTTTLKSTADRQETLDWHQQSPNQVMLKLNSNLETGLSTAEASRRISRFGKNELVATDRRTGFKILLAQLQSSLVILLLVAMLVSFILGEITDGFAILAIIALNTMLGFWQDYRAEKSMAELKKLSVPEVIVRRDGSSNRILAEELIPGDVVILQSGFFVPADCRLVELSHLAIDESALTGESLSVEKTLDAIPLPNLPIGDRINLGFMGTMVVRGHGVAIVTTTGMNTQLGEIASSLQSVEQEPTPLQNRLSQLSRTLAILAILIVSFVFAVGWFAGEPPKLMLLTALSLAVAVVPEGLPAVATVALAIGARRMFKHNALIRQLPAVETLGSVSVICSDKTGTLTQNKMTATILDVANCRESAGDTNCQDHSALQLLLLGACLCNDAELQHADEPNQGSDTTGSSPSPVAVGEPTERALVEVAAKHGFDQLELRGMFPRIGEVEFDSQRKRMTTRHSIVHQSLSANHTIPTQIREFDQIAFAKGAVDAILAESKFVWVGDQAVELDEDWRAKIEKSSNEMAGHGTRVLAVGMRAVEQAESDDELETNVIFIGMIGLSDPPRPEVKLAVERCRQAGIRPIMITGDHPLTALSIARELGISTTDSVVTGQQLDELSPAELRDRVRDVAVFARVAPAHKLHLVEALQHAGEVVAMTGDGVNDAPALKQANVGVAMGLIGTDVSKEASNVVLLDDNFATIVTAVEQGRIVYANIRKFVKYTMSSNIGEVLVMTLGIMMGLPLPLLPLQILWVNLVTDGLPGLALAAEPSEKNAMNRPPISSDEPIFNRRMRLDMIWIGSLIGMLSLASGSLFSTTETLAHWRTVIFSTLTFAQMGNAVAIRSNEPLSWGRNSRQNWWLWGAIASTCILQIVVIYVPFLQQVFNTQSLSLPTLAACVSTGFVVFGLIEIQKRILLRIERSRN